MIDLSMRRVIPVILVLGSAIGFADIDNLRFLGHNEVNWAHLMDAEVVGDRAYICVGFTPGLEVYDISDPANPQRLYRMGPKAWRAVASGDTLLFLFCRLDGVVLYDISTSGSPVQLGQFNPSGSLEALEGGDLIGTTLYSAAHQNGIYAIDISNPSNPKKIDEIGLDTSAAWNIEAKDSFLYVANGRFGFTVVGIDGGLHIASKLPLSGCANDLVLDGDVAVVSLGPAGLATVDISDPYNPVLLDTIATGGNVWGSGITGHLVVTGSWYLMELFDITDPAQIQKIGWDNTKTFALGADIRDDSLIAVADWRGMSCYQVGPDTGPDIDLEPQLLDFSPVSGSVDTQVIVRNTGSTFLNVSSVSTPTGITANPASFSVPPGDSQVVTITASGSGTVAGNITYYSNDPDESARQQEVYKNNTSFPHYGSLAPDFNLEGTDGQWHRLSDYRGKVVYLEFGGAW
ncbi:MAG TPA: hypothetical protein EYP58_04025 [bacterium (Candidatus Stahlbacteria)]|nr:hypothetical protein [Candidatus Stahlbacteria bacterium]